MATNDVKLGLLDSNSKALLDSQYFIVDLTDKIPYLVSPYTITSIDITNHVKQYFDLDVDSRAITNICIKYENVLFYVGDINGYSPTVYATYTANSAGKWSGILKLEVTNKVVISIDKVLKLYNDSIPVTVPAKGIWYRIAKLNGTGSYATITLTHAWNHQQPGYVKFFVGCNREGSGKSYTIRKIAENTGFIRKLRTNYDSNGDFCYVEIFLRSTSMTILSSDVKVSSYGSITEYISCVIEECNNAIISVSSNVTLLNTQSEVQNHGIIEYEITQDISNKYIRIPIDAKFVYFNQEGMTDKINILLEGPQCDMQHDITIFNNSTSLCILSFEGTDLNYNNDGIHTYRFTKESSGTIKFFQVS